MDPKDQKTTKNRERAGIGDDPGKAAVIVPPLEQSPPELGLGGAMLSNPAASIVDETFKTQTEIEEVQSRMAKEKAFGGVALAGQYDQEAMRQVKSGAPSLADLDAIERMVASGFDSRDREIRVFREEMEARFQALRDELAGVTAMQPSGLAVKMVGGTFECQLCGLRILGPSMTSQKDGTYEHPFDPSQKLGGKQCELKGARFKAPIVFLQYTQPRPLTPKAE